MMIAEEGMGAVLVAVGVMVVVLGVGAVVVAGLKGSLLLRLDDLWVSG